MDLPTVKAQSEYWASAVENARCCLIRDMSALPNGLFSNKQDCAQYAADLLVRVTSKMDAVPSESGVRDSSECFKEISLQVLDPLPRIHH